MREGEASGDAGVDDRGATPVFPRAVRLRFLARVTLVLWVASFVMFVVLVGSRVEDRVLSALGVLASIFFATSWLAQSAANRRELRELSAMAARADVVAASRLPRRVRGFVAREASVVGSSRPGARRDRSATRPPSAPPR